MKNKKVIIIILITLVVCIASITAFFMFNINPKTLQKPPETTNPSDTTPLNDGKNNEPPKYIPGSIKLHDGILEGYNGTHRFVFYGVPGYIADLAENKEIVEKFLEFYELNDETMFIKDFVKHFNVPKEKFTQAVEEHKQFLLDYDIDIMDEEYELPNAEIIYTFDDKIISEYYQRK